MYIVFERISMLLLKMPFLSSIHNPACSRHCISIHYSIMPTPDIPYDWSILTLDVNHVNTDFKIQRNDSNENVKEKKNQTKKAIGLISKQQLCTCITHFSAFLCRFRVLWRTSASINEIFFSMFLDLDMVPWNSTSGIIAIKTERTQIHFLSDVLVAVTSLDKEKNKASAKILAFYKAHFDILTFVISIRETIFLETSGAVGGLRFL